MDILATISGLLAVALFVFSYQLKARESIIVANAASRILYVLQYLLLGALEGAILDTAAFFVSLLCKKSDAGFIKKHFLLTLILSNVFLIGLGMLTYQNIFSLLPIAGVVFETLALWLKKERHIRITSLLGAPFWLAYNLKTAAYGSVVGNVITLISISVAILRYDVLKKNADASKKA